MEIPTIQPDGKEACVMPTELEEHYARRILWQEFGLHYDDTPNEQIAQALAFRDLERQHPYRRQRAEREAQGRRN